MSASDPHMTPGLTVVRIERDDPHYAAERRLRYEMLRRPLDMPLGSEENPREADAWHWVALDSANRVVGCVLWLPGEGRSGRLIQMAVSPEVQKSGIGRLLVMALEDGVRATADEVTLHARDTAIGFYQRLGYSTYGEPFTEVGIAHAHMHKRIN